MCRGCIPYFTELESVTLASDAVPCPPNAVWDSCNLGSDGLKCSCQETCMTSDTHHTRSYKFPVLGLCF